MEEMVLMPEFSHFLPIYNSSHCFKQLTGLIGFTDRCHGSFLYRMTMPFTSQQEFNHKVSRLFSEPERLVMGEETAVQASTRFTRAVKSLIARHPQETLIIVSHGTVISLFYQSVLGLDPYPFWEKLGLPSYLIFELPALDLIEVRTKIV